MHTPFFNDSTMDHRQRIIGRFQGEMPGPLLICLTGMHGNEMAGVIAAETIFDLLEVEPSINPSFYFRGAAVGLRGNLRAIAEEVRFVDKDLNRQWTEENMQALLDRPAASLQNEDREQRELYDTIKQLVHDIQPERLIILDLHTTAAEGGIFSIPNDTTESLDIAKELHAPVIRGMLAGIKGTTLHYFQGERFGVPTNSVAFEGGQHKDPLSINRSIAAIINCMRTIGCVRGEDVENRHDKLLISYSEGLPKVAKLISRHPVSPEDRFRMNFGFKNFQSVRKGESLAKDVNGDIVAPFDAMLLMPLYQPQGEDGFFLIQPEQY